MDDKEILREEIIKKEEKLVAALFLVLSAMFLLLSIVESHHGRFITIVAAFSSGGNLAMALWIYALRRVFQHTSQRALYVEALGLFLGRQDFPLVKLLLAVVVLLGIATAFLYMN